MATGASISHSPHSDDGGIYLQSRSPPPPHSYNELYTHAQISPTPQRLGEHAPTIHWVSTL